MEAAEAAIYPMDEYNRVVEGSNSQLPVAGDLLIR
jgi:hypothetical protein